MNIEKILLNPAEHYSCPADVCQDTALSREDKIRILRRWEYDARELQVADEENMSGGPPDLLPDVLTALHSLGDVADIDKTPPTKQGGG